MNNVLEQDLNDVEQRFQLEVFFKENKKLDFIPDLYIDPRRMLDDITKHRHVHVLTYSLKPNRIITCGVVRQVVVGLKPDSPLILLAGLRYLCGLHTKLFLGYNYNYKIQAAYVGSLNMVKPTNLNLGVRITNKAKLEVLCGYYEAVWNLAKEIET